MDGIDSAIRDLRNYIFGLRPGLLADRELEGSASDMTGSLCAYFFYGGEQWILTRCTGVDPTWICIVLRRNRGAARDRVVGKEAHRAVCP